jgi:hypothetical protein
VVDRQLLCGPGTDSASIDASDPAPDACESVTRY